jgi:hypothetical protein
MPRSCGDCNVCCIYPEIPEIGKAQGHPCAALAAHRCSIYATRPKTCASYSCEWLKGHGAKQDRPDVSGILVDERDSQFGQVLVARGPGLASKAGKKAVKRIHRDRASMRTLATIGEKVEWQLLPSC